MYGHRRPPSLGGGLFAAAFWLAAVITVACWRHMRQRSPSWQGPTLVCVLAWVVIYLNLRGHR